MRISVLVLVFAAALPRIASAQAASDLGLRLKTGDTVYVLDNASREVTGVFGKISDSRLTLMVNGELRDFSLSEVRQVTRRGGDSLWNGILIGAAVGGAAGGAMQGLSTGIGGAVIYGAIGGVIDRLVEGRVVVYRSKGISKAVGISPLITNDGKGVRIGVSF